MFIACTAYSVWRNGIREFKNRGLLTCTLLSLVTQEVSVSRGDPLYANFQYLFPSISGPNIGGTVCKNSPHWGSDTWTTIFPADKFQSHICLPFASTVLFLIQAFGHNFWAANKAWLQDMNSHYNRLITTTREVQALW
jgi:hypothetical protein